MSTFLDCIRSAVDSGRITAEKAQEAEAAFTQAYEDGIAEGLAESAARDAAANRAVERTMKLTGEKRWRRINELRRAHELYTRLTAATDLPETLDRIGAELEVAYRRTLGQAHSYMANNLEKYRPKVAGLHHSVRDMDDIAYAAYGENVTNTSAKELAEELLNAQDFLRRMANMYGAAIPANPNRRLPQSHDRLKIAQVTREEWVADQMGRLDWKLMRYNDRPIAVGQREAILGRVYDTIRTEGANKITPGHTSAEHLAARLSKERFLYYKDAKSYLEMQKKYGAGNIFQQSIGMIDSMARDISTLEKLGPNPSAMRNFIANTAKNRAAELELAKPVRRGKSHLAKTNEALETFDNVYDLHNRLVMNGDENVGAQSLATARTVVLSSVLSGAYIANLADLAFFKYNALINNMPMFGHTRAYIKHFLPNRENRQVAIRSGLIAESATSIAMGYQRHFGLLDGPQWARRYADVINRMQLLTPHVQATRWAHGMEMMGAFYDWKGLSYDNLPIIENLRRAGITEADWNIFRNSPTFKDRGSVYLRPIDLANSPNGNSTQNQIVANKFLDLIQWDARTAIPHPSERVQAAMGQHIPASTIMGQVARTVGALKTFPVTVMMMQGKDILRQPTPGEKLRNAAAFFVFLTGAGAFVTQARELAYGRDPYDMRTGDFWMRAVVNGGSLGLLGDLAADSIQMFGKNSGGDMLGGPIPEFFERSLDLTVGNLRQFVQGEDTDAAREAIRWMRSYGPRLWQLRLLMDRLVYDTLMQHADPEAYRRLKRMEQRRANETGQGAWWGMGEQPRAPNLPNAIGR